MLTFAIPSYDRDDRLIKCLDSIISEIVASGRKDVKVFVHDNANTDNTTDILKHYKQRFFDIVDYRRSEEWVGAEESIRRSMLGSETEWTWTMGNDDVLLPGVLPVILDLLQRKPYQFVHVAEESRTSNTRKIFKASLEELCSFIGLTDMTGFISGNIYRTAPVKKAFSGELHDAYANAGAFLYSCLLYDIFRDQPAAYIDIAAVALQDITPTETTNRNWGKERTAIRYVGLVEGLDTLVSRGKLTKPVPLAFLRYLSSDMMSKVLHVFTSMTIAGHEITQQEWDQLRRMLAYLPDEEANSRIAFLDAYKGKIDRYVQVVNESEALINDLNEDFRNNHVVGFPTTYIMEEHTNGRN